MKAVFDLHCDLLGCVQHDEEKWNFESPEINCSVPQLLEGNVKFQVLALATVGGDQGALEVARQLELYDELLNKYPDQIVPFHKKLVDDEKLHTVLAFENCSGIAREDEHLDTVFKRIDTICTKGKVLYASLTWNGENRFGGGNATSEGLKSDGEVLVEYLAEKGISIDFSHTSAKLADDLLNFIARRNIEISPIASHSNFARIQDVPRNLPDDVAKEIGRLGGVIGLNFVHRFVGAKPDDFLRHIDHALTLGLEDHLALGADFYGGLDIPVLKKITGSTSSFFPQFSNSGCYQHFLQFIGKQFGSAITDQIAHKNLKKFLHI